MNKKLLTPLLITSIIVFSAGSAYAWFHHTTKWMWMNNIELTDEQKAEMEASRALFDKVKNWETLTAEEEATLETMETNMWGVFNWDRKGMWMHHIGILTEEQIAEFEAMTTEEKQAYMQTLREEMRAKQESHETVIDKLLAGETLTSEEEIIRQEIIKERANRKNKVINE